MIIYIHGFPERPSDDLSVSELFGSKRLFCVHEFFFVRGDSKCYIQWFILSPRNAINAVIECIHNIITYCMIPGTQMNITPHKTLGQKKFIST